VPLRTRARPRLHDAFDVDLRQPPADLLAPTATPAIPADDDGTGGRRNAVRGGVPGRTERRAGATHPSRCPALAIGLTDSAHDLARRSGGRARSSPLRRGECSTSECDPSGVTVPGQPPRRSRSNAPTRRSRWTSSAISPEAVRRSIGWRSPTAHPNPVSRLAIVTSALSVAPEAIRARSSTPACNAASVSSRPPMGSASARCHHSPIGSPARVRPREVETSRPLHLGRSLSCCAVFRSWRTVSHRRAGPGQDPACAEQARCDSESWHERAHARRVRRPPAHSSASAEGTRPSRIAHLTPSVAWVDRAEVSFWAGRRQRRWLEVPPGLIDQASVSDGSTLR
jgi:hypothetical protein